MDRANPGDISSTSILDDGGIDTGLKDIPMQDIINPESRDIEANSSSINKDSHHSEDSGDDTQAGVKNIEAVSMTWTKWGLIMAYIRYTKDVLHLRILCANTGSIFLMAFTTSLEGQVVLSLSVFATSSFNNHSLISTVYVVQGVVNGV